MTKAFNYTVQELGKALNKQKESLLVMVDTVLKAYQRDGLGTGIVYAMCVLVGLSLFAFACYNVSSIFLEGGYELAALVSSNYTAESYSTFVESGIELGSRIAQTIVAHSTVVSAWLAAALTGSIVDRRAQIQDFAVKAKATAEVVNSRIAAWVSDPIGDTFVGSGDIRFNYYA